MKKLIYFLLFITSTYSIYTQTYDAPKLICVQKTTQQNNIIWELPNVVCGTFVSYDIYFSNDISTPFSLLTNVTDINATVYNHQGIDESKTYYYFLKSNFSCGSNISTSSDTIDNIKVSQPFLKVVTIEDQKPTIIVYKNEDKESWGYPILMKEGDDLKLIDTLILGTEYQDLKTDVNLKANLYSVAHMDKCGGQNGTTAYTTFQQPVLLSLVEDKCNGSINLSWSSYLGWGIDATGTDRDTVENYQVFLSLNESIFQSVATQAYDNKSFIFNEYNFGDSVCVYIQSTNPFDNSIISKSNKICFRASKVQKPKDLKITSIQFSNSSIAKINWFCDDKTQYKEFRIKVFNKKSKKEIKEIIIAKPEKLDNNNYYFIDSQAITNQETEYKLLIYDQCNNYIYGNSFSPSFIYVDQINAFTNNLTWTDNAFDTVTKYEIQEIQIWFLKNDNTEYTQIYNSSNLSERKTDHDIENFIKENNLSTNALGGRTCYKIKTKYKITNVDSLKDSVLLSSSNIVCNDLRTITYIPNAMVINGINNVFKPKFVFFQNIETYNLEIYNRWGKLIYQSYKIDEGWKGYDNDGKEQDPDNYLYIIKYKDNNDMNVTKSGNILLLKK